MTMIDSDQSIEQMCAARDRLVRAMNAYDLWIAETGSSHFSNEARAIHVELRLSALLAELDRHLAKVARGKLRRYALPFDATSYSRSETDGFH
jgi:hypothetical protein